MRKYRYMIVRFSALILSGTWSGMTSIAGILKLYS
jgi:hypothetical protein